MIDETTRETQEEQQCFDVLLPRSAAMTGVGPGLGLHGVTEEAVMFALYRWATGSKIHVRFMDGHPTVQERVKRIAKEWEEHVNVELVFDNALAADLRITFKPGGSWSLLGTSCQEVPRYAATMNYGWLSPGSSDDIYRRVVLHEFGHALALGHEHGHPQHSIPWNKEAVYQSYGGYPNFWTRDEVDRQVFTRYSHQTTNFSEYDPKSIMHYPIDRSLLTDPSRAVGLNQGLSDVDKQFMSQMYPFDKAPATQLEVNAPAVQADISQAGEEDLFAFSVLTAGQYVIETEGATDVFMSLFPAGSTLAIAADDDSGPGLNPRLSKFLQQGKYQVQIRHYSKHGTGKYTIRVKR